MGLLVVFAVGGLSLVFVYMRCYQSKRFPVGIFDWVSLAEVAGISGPEIPDRKL